MNPAPELSRSRLDRRPAAGRLLAAAALLTVVGLQILAVGAQSLTGDGAHHLLAGHQALRYGHNTVNLEHPPLVKLVIALPSTWEEPLAPPVRPDEALAAATRIHARPEILRRVTIRGRFLALAVFVLPLFYACYALGRRFGGRRAGFLLTLMVGLSFSILPYLSVLQTDAAAALAFVLTLLTAAHYAERASLARAAALGLACGLGLAVKFSAVLLAPTVLAALAFARAGWRRCLASAAMVAAAALLVVEASYLAANPAYSSETGREVIRAYCGSRGSLAVSDRMASAEEPLLALERLEPRLAQWATGFWGIRVQNAIGVYPSFAFGEVRSAGRWWYFPAVLLVKTPLPILMAALAATLAMARGRQRPGGAVDWRLLILTVTVYLAAAMTSNYNLSVRHLLPILPMLYLPVALWTSRVRLGAWLLTGALALEALALAPLWMSATNTWWLGSSNPTRFALGAGNLEYRQNFVQLARSADANGLERLKVVYPALGEEVIHAYLPDAHLVKAGEALEPGWYAVNVIVEQLVPALLEARPGDVWGYDELRSAAEQWQPTWRAIQRGEDHGYVAGTFHLYHLGPSHVGAAGDAPVP